MMKTGLVVVSSPPGACACSVPLVLLLQQGRPPVREVSSLLPPVVCWCFLYAASVQSTHSLWGQCGRWPFAPPAQACNALGFDCGWHPNGSILLGLLFLHLLSLCPCYYLCSSSLPSLCPQEAISEWLVSVAFTEKYVLWKLYRACLIQLRRTQSEMYIQDMDTIFLFTMHYNISPELSSKISQ